MRRAACHRRRNRISRIRRRAVRGRQRLAARGWLSGLYREGSDVARVPLPRLVVVDYAESVSPKQLDALMAEFSAGATSYEPVRLLLITRPSGQQGERGIWLWRSGLRGRRLAILKQVKKTLGARALKELHIHLSGIDYGPKGEKKHLRLSEADLKYKDLFKALVDMKCAGRVLCESPVMEDDALIMQKTWRRLAKSQSPRPKSQ